MSASKCEPGGLNYSDKVKFTAPKAFVAKLQIKSIHVFIYFSIS